jgi:delta 1-pyrroline-5-carboxylate dehydrogenase
MSGLGSKTGGPDYLLQFTEPRTITENTLRRGYAPSMATAQSLMEEGRNLSSTPTPKKGQD